MKFPTKFSRWKGAAPAGSITLGTDTTPSAAPSASADNVLFSRFSSINGWPCCRIPVVYRGPALAPNLPASMYFWEESTGAWYKIGSGTLKPNEVTFFDVVALLDNPNAGNPATGYSPGSIAQMLIVSDNAGPNGEYQFAMAPDLTTTP